MSIANYKEPLKNPRQGASLLSLITFAFTFSTFRKGRRRDLQDDDVYEILDDFKSNLWGRRLQRTWNKELNDGNQSFLRALFHVFGGQFIMLGVIYFCGHTIPLIIQPILIGNIVDYFDNTRPDHSLSEAYFSLGSLICLITFHAFFLFNYSFAINQLAFKVQIACCSLIYRKSLKLNSHTLSPDTNGRIITLMTKDVLAIYNAVNMFHEIGSAIVMAFVMLFFMYRRIGVAAIVGFSVLLLVTPMQVLLGKLAATYRAKTTKQTDLRVRLTQEILVTIKIIKMYTWDWFFMRTATIFRRDEIHHLRSVFYTLITSSTIGGAGAKLSLLVCAITYVTLGHQVTANDSFFVIGYFSTLGVSFGILFPIEIGHVAKSKVFIDRLKEFLLEEETQPPMPATCDTDFANQSTMGIRTKNVHVKDKHETRDILNNISLELHQGLTILTGDVGSGKSALFHLLIGNQKSCSGTMEIAGRISYASQEPWLFPGTIRENIVFAGPFEPERYAKVLQCCALRDDLKLFPAGDQYRVIDHGLNLSGGQRARVNLARAIYRHADIYLLDDCLSSVDAAVSREIFDNCIRQFLAQKVCVMTTHVVDYMKVADRIVVMNGGRVDFAGPFHALEQWNPNYETIIGKRADFHGSNDEEVTVSDCSVTHQTEGIKGGQRGLYEEEQKIGKVDIDVYKKYILYGGGYVPFVLIAILFAVSQVYATIWDYYVGVWVNQEGNITAYQLNNQTDSDWYKLLIDQRTSDLCLYTILILLITFFAMIKGIAYINFVAIVSKRLHTKMMAAILDAKMLFVDKHLTGNILNRFSRDLCITDEYLPTVIMELIECACVTVGALATAAMANVWLLVPAAIFLFCLILARQYYIPVGRSIMRLDGSTRSPLVGHINASLDGLTTIQANEAQTKQTNDFDERHDHYNSAHYMILMTVRAFGLYINLICVLYITVVVLSFFLFHSSGMAGRIGVAITRSFAVIALIQWAIKQWSELENCMTATERSLEYTQVPTESLQSYRSRKLPSLGRIEFSHVRLRYATSTRIVLNDLSFVVEAGEKIGVVGRTGAGKSSIISVLFKLYDYDGSVVIDGVDSRLMNTKMMRGKISVIPQEPVIFSGTVRTNIDCSNQYTDDELWKIIDEVHVRDVIASLDTDIADIAHNLSTGQKQLICLARAIINKNPILMVDEATANVDPQTDALIRDVIASHFARQTVITIAHRLKTIIDCDKVLVLNNGEMIEYDNPRALIKQGRGLFYSMAQNSGLVN